VILTGFGIAEPASRSQAADVEQPLRYISDGRKRIALTIDDGPSPVYTPQILSLLHRYRITAAFSMIGINVEAHQGEAREVAEAGHLIVNHTWTHPDLAVMSSAAARDEMAYGADAIHRVTGRLPSSAGEFGVINRVSAVTVTRCEPGPMLPRWPPSGSCRSASPGSSGGPGACDRREGRSRMRHG
jgi:peptidoglycan/xylan/chitin deacetylase (PgdA/CDA1 family)